MIYFTRKPIECPHCDRKFADFAFLEDHIEGCRQRAQRELDEEYARLHSKPDPKELLKLAFKEAQ